MKRFLLFIRETGNEDIADFHPDVPAARRALADYVRDRLRENGQPHHHNDDVAIADYFQNDQALYAIACVGSDC